jgi:hypothetical protein
MPGGVSLCDLCKKVPRRRGKSVLCQDCADAVSRVMSVDKYEANHHRDRQAQLAQARLLVRAATASNTTSKDKPQAWIWF